jgi:hypothetical protein
LIPSTPRKHPIYNSVYVFWSKLLLFELLPYLVIMVCNAFILAKIYKASKFRQKFAGSSTNVKTKLSGREEFGIQQTWLWGFVRFTFMVFRITTGSPRNNMIEEGSVFLPVCLKW